MSKTNVTDTSIKAYHTKVLPKLSKLQYAVLRAIFHKDSATYHDVMQLTKLTQGNTTGRINELYKKSFIKIVAEKDGCHVYALTKKTDKKNEIVLKGKKVIADLKAEIERLNETLTERNRTIQNQKGEILSLRQIYKQQQ
jgi:DNA-binding MarR family transcriptional regulator